MPSAAALRIEIEHSLERRFPAALTPAPRTIRETAATGIDEVDRLLEGGLPVGAISEVTGAESSGRTSLTLAFLAQRTRQGQVCAWVDAHDALDSESAAASGVNLRQLLWVRCCGSAPTAKQAGKMGQFSGIVGQVSTSGAKARLHFEPLAARLKSCPVTKPIGNPAGTTLPATRTSSPAAGVFSPTAGTTWPAAGTSSPTSGTGFRAGSKDKPWSRLEQALKATDLLLQAGGFGALVLDLGSTAAEHGCRIPLATWFRFRQAADRTRCSLLVLAQEPLAQSSAAVVVECTAQRAAAGSETVLSGWSYQVRSGRQRFTPQGRELFTPPERQQFMQMPGGLRKQPASTWTAAGAWQREEHG